MFAGKRMISSGENSVTGARKQRPSGLLMAAAVLGIICLGIAFTYLRMSDNSVVVESSTLPTAGIHNQLGGEAIGPNTDPVAGDPAAPSQSLPSNDRLEPDPQASGPDVPENRGENERPERTISGSVLDDAGQLLPGASVVARQVDLPAPDASTDQASSTQTQQTRTTDSLGGFEFENLPLGEYELTATKGEEFRPGYLKVRAGMANAEVVLQRIRSLRVYGRITDKAGMPLDVVTVRALGSHSQISSDVNGAYEIVLEPMGAGKPPVLDFRREGYQQTRRRVETAPGPNSDQVQLDVEMEPETIRPKVALGGQVLGPIGEAVEGARVRLDSSPLQKHFSAFSDASGTFSFPEVDAGDGYKLRVAATDEYAAYESAVFSLGSEDVFLNIALKPAEFANLSGTVTDLNGRPLGGFTLWLRGVGSSSQPPVPVQADGSGRFRLEKLRAGEVKLESRSQPLLAASDIVLEPGRHRHVEVPLDWGQNWLLGRIVDNQGQPVAGARVVLSWRERFWDVSSESRREVMSDLEGFFAVSNLGARDYVLTVQAAGYQSTRIQHRMDSDNQELRVLLHGSGA